MDWTFVTTIQVNGETRGLVSEMCPTKPRTEAMNILCKADISIDYRQFYMTPSADDFQYLEDFGPEVAFEGHRNGLCGVSLGDRIFFTAGIHHGILRVMVQLHKSAPDLDSAYEEVVEVSIERREVPIYLYEWAWENAHELELEKGLYRLRYSIDGMEKDQKVDESTNCTTQNQNHLIQIWPSERKTDKILKRTTQSAEYWHKVAQSGWT